MKITAYPDLLAYLQEDLTRINGLIREYVERDVPLLTDIVNYVFTSGGKRIRPVMTLLAGKLFGVSQERIHSVAALIEFVHTATLLHDDVIDNANMRRSRKTARLLWGNEASVLVGDYLFSLTFKIISRQENSAILNTLANATTRMAKGELLQLSRSYDTDRKSVV